MNRRQEILNLVQSSGILRSRDLDPLGIPRVYLQRLCDAGQLEKIGRGMYALPGADFGEYTTLIEAAQRIPKGVICLLSALRFHELTTESPFEVWMSLPRSSWQPKIDYPALRFVRISDSVHDQLVEEHDVRGAKLRVYTVARTIADCFKFRNQIGVDVARAALRDAWSKRQVKMEDIWSAAKLCRMTNVMQPYVESIL